MIEYSDLKLLQGDKQPSFKFSLLLVPLMIQLK